MVQVEWHRYFYFLIRLIYLHQVQYFVTGQVLGRSPWFCDCSLGSPGKCTSYHNAFSALMLLVGWQEGRSSCKNWVVGCWSGYLSGSKCRLAYGPADATATHCLFSKIQIDLPFWYRLTWVVPEKRPLNVCMCVCVCHTIMCACVWLTGVIRGDYWGEGMPGRPTSVEENLPDLSSWPHGKTDRQPGAELRMRMWKVVCGKGTLLVLINVLFCKQLCALWHIKTQKALHSVIWHCLLGIASCRWIE